MSQDLEDRIQRAVENFMSGYGCAQSVLAAFADLYGLDDIMAKRIAAGFGGSPVTQVLVPCTVTVFAELVTVKVCRITVPFSPCTISVSFEVVA